MIITRISGGIGNQLFQYAMGRSLSLKNGGELKLDTHAFELGIEKGRSFKLPHFTISAAIATGADWKQAGIPNPLDQSFLSKLKRKISGKIIIEKDPRFHSEILDMKGDIYLSGVWQSEKYFKAIEKTLRQDIKLKDEPSPAFKQWAEKMKNAQSVSLHIRRGDYVTSSKTNEKHGVCDISYYNEAVRIISEKIPSPTFFVFSDDIQWAKENLKFPYPLFFVSDHSLPDCEELVLMSICKNNIMANSSFSWWGAWLNENPDKTVIAPKRWFNASHIPSDDILPEGWMAI